MPSKGNDILKSRRERCLRLKEDILDREKTEFRGWIKCGMYLM